MPRTTASWLFAAAWRACAGVVTILSPETLPTRLEPGQTYAVKPGRPHLVTNGGDVSAVFLVLQGLGEYDYVPLT